MSDEANSVTLRDQFAMNAIASILTTNKIPPRVPGDHHAEAELLELAEIAYRLADAMLSVREKSLAP